MKVGDKVTYQFYDRPIYTRIREIRGEGEQQEVLVVGLASWQPIQMFTLQRTVGEIINDIVKESVEEYYGKKQQGEEPV
jgi:hypothetical protein